MRIIHTSDWHLGKTLHDHPRREEHRRFLEWLLELVAAEEADALLVAGDVFETANPPADAQADWYDFLARARQRFPSLDVVVIGGNHDSAARLDAPDPLLRRFGLRVVGGLPRREGGLDFERLVVPITDREGRTAAWVCAVPFLRTADLPSAEGEGDPLIEGVRRIYSEVLEEARRRREPGQALVAMGHLYMVGGQLSELSERKILGGNQHALPVEIFSEEVAYAALGHLHLAQRVGGLEHVRYSGSPIPLSMPEAEYRHQVLVVDFDGERLGEVRPVRIPRTVELLRPPETGPLPLEDVLVRLAALPETDPTVPFEERPFLEVRVKLDRPVPGLREKIESALQGKHVRLVTLTASTTGDGLALGDAAPQRDLRELTPEEVFLRRYARDHEGEVPPELLECFHELVQGLAEDREVA